MGARQRVLLFGSTALAASLPSPARAYEARVEASLDGQFYWVRSPFGDPVVPRRRYTSTLGLELERLEGDAARRGAPELGFRSRLRVDADFGTSFAERDPASNRFVPGLAPAPLDLMYAYFEGRGLFDGLIGFRLGRQYVVDALGWWSFDGALATLSLPIHVQLNAFAGFEQRTGLPMLATPRFSADGVTRGDRGDLEQNQYTTYLDDSALAPAAGASIETADLALFHAEIGYRKVQNRSRVLVSPFADELGRLESYGEPRTSAERAFVSARADLPDLGALQASAVYDLYLGRASDAGVAVDAYATPDLVLGADLEYALPAFDGDSIFNWFSHHPTTTGRLRASASPSRAIDLAGSAGVRVFETEGDPDSYGEPPGAPEPSRATHRSLDKLIDAGARLRIASGSVALRGQAEHGERGHLIGMDVTTRKRYLGGRYDSLVVLSLYDWSDALRESRDATSFTYVLGAGITPGLDLVSDGRIGVEWEHTLNRLVAQRFRLLLTLDFTVLR